MLLAETPEPLEKFFISRNALTCTVLSISMRLESMIKGTNTIEKPVLTVLAVNVAPVLAPVVALVVPAVTALALWVWAVTAAMAATAERTVVPVVALVVPVVPEAVVLPVVGLTAPTEPTAHRCNQAKAPP